MVTAVSPPPATAAGLLELEVIGFFKRRQRVRTFDKFRGGGQLKVAPFFR
jgi:hypothetical protein